MIPKLENVEHNYKRLCCRDKRQNQIILLKYITYKIVITEMAMNYGIA